MIKIFPNSKIYVMCVANYASGGPELMHQLAFELRNLGFDAVMYYRYEQGKEKKYPVHDNYKMYQVPYVDSIIDDASNFLVFPEIYMDSLYTYSKVNYILWWLSVDYAMGGLDLKAVIKNNEKVEFKSILLALVKIFKIIPFGRELYKKFPMYYLKKLTNNQRGKLHHLSQSAYANHYLLTNGIQKVDSLSDYLRADFLVKSKQVSNKKEDIVLYNPKKGFEFTKEIIAHAKEGIKFVAIENMSVEQVFDLLSKTKVYIDFGNHPGKDRIPREAAILGCCVITGLKGSAKFNDDIPILAKYKFLDSKSKIPEIVNCIENCLKNYEEAIKDFANYKAFIENEQSIFKMQVAKIFVKAEL